MAGIYIHIPFCKSRCIYCGFYSTIGLELRQRYVDAVCKEMESRCRECITNEGKKDIETIYIGGGTPSQLNGNQLEQLFIYINKVYGMKNVKEITMECNPDDITDAFADMLSQLPVNRVSMGAQTFNNERLRFLHRRHTAEQIPIAVERLRKAGIDNISIDLMYGFPNETIDDWHHDIEQALRLNVEHISAYALMYEEGTQLFQLLEQGKVQEIDEELSLQMYSDLIDCLNASDYEHYEISNFARRNEAGSFRSRHNSSYWNHTPYIGLGAAAHSYDGKRCRRWNIDNIMNYMEGMESGMPRFEQELLDDNSFYNDIVMTSLRTCTGLDLGKLSDSQARYCLQQAQRYLNDNLLKKQDNHLMLTRKGLFVSNMIMSELMIV